MNCRTAFAPSSRQPVGIKGLTMNHDAPHAELAAAVEHELKHLRDEWWWFLVLGILLIVSGTVALFYPFLASVAAVMVLGVSLLVSGAATIVAAFWAGKKW